MTKQVLEELLPNDKTIVRDGDRLSVASGAAASLYASIGIESLVIDRVSELRLEKQALVVLTEREERYVLAYEDVRAFRVAARERSAGY